ncbi:MAG: flavodoxin [Lachnospiraceae bacterium]|nr:flavodoxin [Lachnospiraceae bacterium]
MSKVAVVYWSQTGNTKLMAEAVLKGAADKGADASIFEANDFSASMAVEFDAFAFGCPAMGAEELEDTEFEPMFSAVEGALVGKKVVLFGSYGWGDGQWMRDWEDRCKNHGITLAAESVLANETPDDEAIAACNALGETIA